MTTFTFSSRVPHPVEDVFAWHARPGALTRLTPAWTGSVVEESSPPLQDGTRSRLRVAVPGSYGLASVPWTAEHHGFVPGREFRDRMVKGPLASWEHHHRFDDDGHGGTLVTDTVEYATLPGSRAFGDRLMSRSLGRQFETRSRRLAADLDLHSRYPGRPLTVAVTGASGTIGVQLAALLGTGGHTVLRLVRRAARTPLEISWDPEAGELDPAALRGVDVVVNLAGRSIGGRLTDAAKEQIHDSRVLGTRLLVRALTALGDEAPSALINGSAIGYYGADTHGETVTEKSPPGDDFLAEVCTEWERAAQDAEAIGTRVVTVRTGVVQSPAGGALKAQLPLFLAGLGGRLGSGEQWLSWISLDDAVGLFAHAVLSPGLHGPLNAVAPMPVTGRDYARTLGKVLGRPALLPTPGFGPKLVLGSEGAELMALADQRVSADRAIDRGYRFRHPDLGSALREELGRF
ncbi:TIGR01777 family oxidoreductase [uncultured Kocuria sp.]|uniref:TIGR01777 family oxidoreductase n=1 Tax=uncultured Kocuria sp. TaxID=259305 RepID=UPI0026330201|nr:TIGR01777 family oxidoreductase [uncultured Kocuria sp.]